MNNKTESKNTDGSVWRTEYRNDAGKFHKEDGPAVEYSFVKQYWINGNLHRLDGPAVEYRNKFVEYWIHGRRYSLEEWERVRKLYILL